MSIKLQEQLFHHLALNLSLFFMALAIAIIVGGLIIRGSNFAAIYFIVMVAIFVVGVIVNA